jgi:hypothetical protein
MEQVDASLSYAISTDYSMKEKRRDLLSERLEGQPPKKKLKSLDHSKTKPQIVMLSKQLLEGASQWKEGSESILSQPNNGGIPTIRQIKLLGRRVQDDDEGRARWCSMLFCLGEEADEVGNLPVRDCSCRGDSGFAHLDCLVKYAEQK